MCLLLRPHTKKSNELMPTMFVLQLPGKLVQVGAWQEASPVGREEKCLPGPGFSLDASKEREAGPRSSNPSFVIHTECARGQVTGGPETLCCPLGNGHKGGFFRPGAGGARLHLVRFLSLGLGYM